MQEYPKNPFVKEVPSHLFRFEEKIFGMTLAQLLSDIGAGVGSIALISALPLVARILGGVLLPIPVLILVHGSAQDQPLLYWIYLYARSLIIPRRATWQSLDELKAAGKRKRGQPPPVQEAWIQLDTLEGGIMGYSEPEVRRGGARGRYWAIFEVGGRNVRYLPEQEQVQVFGQIAHVAPLNLENRPVAATSSAPPHLRLAVSHDSALKRIELDPRLLHGGWLPPFPLPGGFQFVERLPGGVPGNDQ